ncbi:MAG: T9SS type A sorting domain-containing protein [Saprospiraceae bacterium]|nr:T9SS type A sorting domain-containing protein [Saprospiraceae bacterium]
MLHDCYLVITEGSASNQIHRTQFNAQFTIVVPTNAKLEVAKKYLPLENNNNYTGVNPTKWTIGSIVIAPISDPAHDFYAIVPTLSPTAQYNNLKSGDSLLLFSLRISPTFCGREARLFENDSDPNSSSAGMAGGDFSNGFTIGGVTQKYKGNIYTYNGDNCDNILNILTYTDISKNGKFDSIQDGSFPFCKIDFKDLGFTTYSDAFGKFSIHLDTGSYNVQISAPFGEWEKQTVDRIIKLSAHIHTEEIGFYPLSTTESSGKISINPSFLRCNNSISFHTTLLNNSSIKLNGYLSIKFDERVTVSSKILPSFSNTQNELVWKVTEIFSGHYFDPGIDIKIPAATSISDSLHFYAYLISSEGDTLYKKYYGDVIRCSYDPNDISVHPDRIGQENYTLRKEILDYTIRFQNTGNDTSFFVRILDVLDKGLDPNSFCIKSASHNVNILIKGDSLNFIFNEIILPESTSNFRASQGYVSFTLEQKDNIQEGDKIFNIASIYFDKNMPIHTNKVLNTIVSDLPCPLKAIWYEEGQIHVNEASKQYDWFDCKTDMLVETTFMPTFKPKKTGSYYALIKGDFCITQTDCISFLSSSAELPQSKVINIFPNPSSGIFTISTPFPIMEITLINAIGHNLETQVFFDSQIEKSINATPLPDGLYTVLIKTTQETFIKKIYKSN